MKVRPPRWADLFLEWYCRSDLLEAIQGDAYELFYRHAAKRRRYARLLFIWNVVRFFRWKNIRKRNSSNVPSSFSSAMLRNMITVAARNFMRQPGSSLLNLAGLSAGFTCAFLILLWIAHEFSFDRFHHDTDRLFRVITHIKSEETVQTFDVASAGIDISSVPEVEALVTASSGDRWPHQLCFRPEGKPNECLYLGGLYANEPFFRVLQFPILRGDPNPLKDPAHIAISERMASRLYGAEDPIGKTLKVDDFHPVTIVSIFKDPPTNSTMQFDWVMTFDILRKEWGVTEKDLALNQFFGTYVKTQAGTTASELTKKLNDVRVVSEDFKKQHVRYEAFPFADWRLHSKFENGQNTGGRIEYVRLFLIIALLVVMMAVINFVNMTTARASTRAKEIGIRKVTGAFRSGIVAQFFGESFLTVLAAFAFSVLLCQLALPQFNWLVGETISVTLLSGKFPFYLLSFLIVVAFAAGIYPALVLSSFQPAKILKSQYEGPSGSNRIRKSLLVVQLTVSTGIIIFSAIVYQQINYIVHKDLGFDRQNMIRIEPTYRLLQKLEPFRQELAASPAIVGITNANVNPLDAGGGNTGVQWPGKPDDMRVAFSTLGCTPEFPQLFGIRILEGRTFSEKTDSVLTEVLVSENAVKTMNLRNPLGTHITVGGVACVVIGVINDFHTSSLRSARLPAILYKTTVMHTGRMFVRYQPGQTRQAFEALQKAYNKFEPSFTMQYWFQDDTFDELYKTERIASRLVFVFMVVALIMAMVGIISLATFNVMRKTKEIGIRRVFGATLSQILALLTSEFMVVLGISLCLAAPVTWYTADRWLGGFAYHTAMPWWWFVISFAGIAGLTIVIITVQAFRTVTSNPTKSLRSE
jgi:putative ABC transport system permease protein